MVPRQYPFSGLVKELGGLEENKVYTLFFCPPDSVQHNSRLALQAKEETVDMDDI